MQRVPFEHAIHDPRLLKKVFYGDGTRRYPGFTFPHQVSLKAFYGMELDEQRTNPATGWNELDYWAICQGSCKFDELGYVKEIFPIPYVAQEYEEMWGVIGRRAAKTSALQSFILAYEAALGGHEEYLGAKQNGLIYLVAQKLELAQQSMLFIDAMLESTSLLEGQVANRLGGEIQLKNNMLIRPSAATIKSSRGFAIPAIGFDEASFWYKDAESANPDYEVERAASWAMVQFPHRKKIGISSVWSKQGLIWDNYQAGTNGCKLQDESKREEHQRKLVVFGTTASFENPVVTRESLQKEKLRDSEAFDRESLSIFPDSVSGFFSRELVEKAAKKGQGISQRSPVDWSKSQILPTYVAAMDPAFRRDSFGFCIGHKDVQGNIVLDVLKKWTPTKGQKLNPTAILATINDLCTEYKVDMVYTDQYQLESLQQLGYNLGLAIVGEDFTGKSKAKIFGSVQSLVNQQKLVLLDPAIHTEDSAMEELIEQLIHLEKTQGALGNIRISAPQGKHDDMAACLALMCYFAVRMSPEVLTQETLREKTIFEIAMEMDQRKQRLTDSDD